MEIVVPSAYRPPNGCKSAARALHYAAACGASAARRTDWIVHMDEETRFNAATVAHVLQHCMSEHARWVAGQCRHAAIGQGVILYNVTAIESTLCALADTICVGDDYGKFALQYRVAAQPLIGMHGSFVVCQAAVEIDFGFDHGIEGSITEDTFFAMHVAAHRSAGQVVPRLDVRAVALWRARLCQSSAADGTRAVQLLLPAFQLPMTATLRHSYGSARALLPAVTGTRASKLCVRSP